MSLNELIRGKERFYYTTARLLPSEGYSENEKIRKLYFLNSTCLKTEVYKAQKIKRRMGKREIKKTSIS